MNKDIKGKDAVEKARGNAFPSGSRVCSFLDDFGPNMVEAARADVETQVLAMVFDDKGAPARCSFIESSLKRIAILNRA